MLQFCFFGVCYNTSKEIYVYDTLHNHSRAGKSRADTGASPACLAARTPTCSTFVQLRQGCSASLCQRRVQDLDKRGKSNYSPVVAQKSCSKARTLSSEFILRSFSHRANLPPANSFHRAHTMHTRIFITREDNKTLAERLNSRLDYKENEELL